MNHTLKATTRNTAKQTATAVQNVGTLLAGREYQSFMNHLSGDSPSGYEDDPEDYVSVEEDEDGDPVSIGQKHPRDDSSDSEDASAKNPRRTTTLKGDGPLTQDGSPSVSARRVSFGRRLTLSDLNPPGYTSPSGLRNLVKSTSSRPSTDTNDPDYHTDQDLHESTTRYYAWSYLEGNGRHDSNVESAWIFNDTEVGQDLMDFRDRVIQENGGLTEPHEKLAVNFIFLVESDHQTRGLNAEVEDKSWTAL